MEQDSTPKILEDYDRRYRLHDAFGDMLSRLISDLLSRANIKVHSVSNRTKERESLQKKLAQPGSKYAILSDVTDISGVRVITYFAEEVDKVASVIEAEFEIDRRNSIDKRKALDPDRFGYLSVHYVVSLKDNRSALTEYTAYRDCVAEIQIRSILQHAWAEIEHDLGYKSESGVPRQARRQFSRLAGLLEIADDGFTALRERLQNYTKSVSEKIENKSEELLIDSVSLLALIDSDPTIKEYDEVARELASGKAVGPNAVDRHAAAAIKLGFKTIGDLKTAMMRDRERWKEFLVAFWTDRGSGANIPRGISLYYLLIFEALQKGDRDPLFTSYFEGSEGPSAIGPFFDEVQKAFDTVTRKSSADATA